jgi:hypothetical protein
MIVTVASSFSFSIKRSRDADFSSSLFSCFDSFFSSTNSRRARLTRLLSNVQLRLINVLSEIENNFAFSKSNSKSFFFYSVSSRLNQNSFRFKNVSTAMRTRGASDLRVAQENHRFESFESSTSSKVDFYLECDQARDANARRSQFVS